MDEEWGQTGNVSEKESMLRPFRANPHIMEESGSLTFCHITTTHVSCWGMFWMLNSHVCACIIWDTSIMLDYKILIACLPPKVNYKFDLYFPPFLHHKKWLLLFALYLLHLQSNLPAVIIKAWRHYLRLSNTINLKDLSIAVIADFLAVLIIMVVTKSIIANNFNFRQALSLFVAMWSSDRWYIREVPVTGLLPGQDMWSSEVQLSQGSRQKSCWFFLPRQEMIPLSELCLDTSNTFHGKAIVFFEIRNISEVELQI